MPLRGTSHAPRSGNDIPHRCHTERVASAASLFFQSSQFLLSLMIWTHSCTPAIIKFPPPAPPPPPPPHPVTVCGLFVYSCSPSLSSTTVLHTPVQLPPSYPPTAPSIHSLLRLVAPRLSTSLQLYLPPPSPTTHTLVQSCSRVAS